MSARRRDDVDRATNELGAGVVAAPITASTADCSVHIPTVRLVLLVRIRQCEHQDGIGMGFEL